MNLEEKLNNSLNDILKSSGYIFEIIHSRKKQSNLITGTNNQLITPVITSQLSNSIAKFEDILDDTICKFNDTKWCVEQMLQNRQKQEELKLKEEEEKQRRIKEDDERKRLEEEDAKKRKKEEEEARIKKEKEEQHAKEEELRKKKEQEQKEKEQKERESLKENEKKGDDNNDNNFDTFMSPSFEFNLNDLPTTNEKGIDIPNPSDILSTISYDGFPENKDSKNADTNNQNNESNNNNDLDLDMNNLLDNDALLLDGLDMNMLDQGFDGTNPNGNGLNDLQDEEFDVDNFLNQFGAD